MKKDLKLLLLAILITASLLGIVFGFNIKKEYINPEQTNAYKEGMGSVHTRGQQHEVAYWYSFRLFAIN